MEIQIKMTKDVELPPRLCSVCTSCGNSLNEYKVLKEGQIYTAIIENGRLMAIDDSGRRINVNPHQFILLSGPDWLKNLCEPSYKCPVCGGYHRSAHKIQVCAKNRTEISYKKWLDAMMCGGLSE